MHNSSLKIPAHQRRLIYQLGKSNVPGAMSLAAILDDCTATAPCRSAACPVCGTAFQLVAVSLVDTFIRLPARAMRSRMHALTIVPATGCLAPDDLTVEACRWVAAEITTALDTLALPPSITGLEVSFNEDMTGTVEPHWGIHAHSIGRDWLSDDQKEGLKAAFPKSRLVKRPIYVESLDQRIQGRLYPFKPERNRRVTGLVTDHSSRNPFRDSKRRDLRPWQAASLALADHELGFSGRLLTHGIDEKAVRRHLEGLGWPRDGP